MFGPRVARVVILLGALVATGCGGGKAPATPARGDPFAATAKEALGSPCAAIPGAGPIPSAPGKRGDADFGYDVVFFLAHPEDETLFTPGTMGALAAGKRRVLDVVLSHGEGGRILDVTAEGDVREMSASPEKVAEVRDREFAKVMETVGLPYEHLYPASARADSAASDVSGHGRAERACKDTLDRWNTTLPEGVAGLLKKLVTGVRTKRPRIVVTHDPRDDEDWLDHGHHKALGALVEIAARMAADPQVALAGLPPPHVVDELVAIAPKQVRADVTLHVGNAMRKKLMSKNISQFEPKKFSEVAERSDERYVVRWRAAGAELPGGTLFASYATGAGVTTKAR